MKLPFTNCDCGVRIKKNPPAFAAANPQSAIRNPHCSGIALVITLIMLSVTLVMAVAFLALARRERGSVTTTTDTTTARLAAETAVANAEAQIVANMFTGASNAYNLRLLVSTNYINPLGFTVGSANPTNVNYFYPNGTEVKGGAVNNYAFEQNVANLFFLPRAPVMISAAEPAGRFYLDLNQNGRFDRNDLQPVISSDLANPYFYYNPNNPNDPKNGTTMPAILPGLTLSNSLAGDPEWVGVLEHPDAPHSANNLFLSRWAFIALPVGNALDLNYIHNQALNNGAVSSAAPIISFAIRVSARGKSIWPHFSLT